MQPNASYCNFSGMKKEKVAFISIFQALSDPHRLRMVELLLRSDDELCLCDFTESLAEPDYKLSRHLKILKECGLLSAARNGKWVYHSLPTDLPSLKYLFLFLKKSPRSLDSDKDYERYARMIKLRGGGRCRRPGSAAVPRSLDAI